METTTLFTIVLNMATHNLITDRIKAITTIRRLIKCSLIEGKELLKETGFGMDRERVTLIVTPEQLGHIFFYQWQEEVGFPCINIEDLKRYLPEKYHDVSTFSVKK